MKDNKNHMNSFEWNILKKSLINNRMPKKKDYFKWKIN